VAPPSVSTSPIHSRPIHSRPIHSRPIHSRPIHSPLHSPPPSGAPTPMHSTPIHSRRATRSTSPSGPYAPISSTHSREIPPGGPTVEIIPGGAPRPPPARIYHQPKPERGGGHPRETGVRTPVTSRAAPPPHSVPASTPSPSPSPQLQYQRGAPGTRHPTPTIPVGHNRPTPRHTCSI